MNNIYASRVEQIRKFMQEEELDAVVILSYDPHSSEYCAPRWQQVRWLSGFTGEAGCIAITRDYAGLWTDSRYFIQAEKQLEGTGIELNKACSPCAKDMFKWIGQQDDIGIIGMDGLCLSLSDEENLSVVAISEDAHYIHIKDYPDMLSRFWKDRPEIPVSTISVLDEKYAGRSRQSKIDWLREYMEEFGYDAIIISALDEIAWMLNIRGNDIEYNPYVISYLVVSMDRVIWFVTRPGMENDPRTQDSFAELRADGIEIAAYDDLNLNFMQRKPRTLPPLAFMDEASANYHIFNKLQREFVHPEQDWLTEKIHKGKSPILFEKAIKNNGEVENLINAYVEDGLALEKFLYWVEKEVASGRIVSEWEASEKLTSLRAEIPGFQGNSFENISAYGANAALPHYSTPREGSAILQPRGFYLVDSGGQYLFGTTDTTRTVPLGECSYLEKEDYTLVLKGMIQLSMAVFPYGTAGCQMDILARNALWRARRNFGHGTGHGIGFYLGVHEGPQSIRQNFNDVPVVPGMVTSNEPGIYREGMHGVRHENVIICVDEDSNEFGDWLSFRTLTQCHIDTSAVLPELMTAEEIEWLNKYNARVYETLAPRLPEDVAVWLKAKTAAI